MRKALSRAAALFIVSSLVAACSAEADDSEDPSQDIDIAHELEEGTIAPAATRNGCCSPGVQRWCTTIDGGTDCYCARGPCAL